MPDLAKLKVIPDEPPNFLCQTHWTRQHLHQDRLCSDIVRAYLHCPGKPFIESLRSRQHHFWSLAEVRHRLYLSLLQRISHLLSVAPSNDVLKLRSKI